MNDTTEVMAALQAASQALRTQYQAQQAETDGLFAAYQEANQGFRAKARRITTQELKTDAAGVQGIQEVIVSSMPKPPSDQARNEAIGTLIKSFNSGDHLWIAAVLQGVVDSYECGMQLAEINTVRDYDREYNTCHPHYPRCLEYIELVHGFTVVVPEKKNIYSYKFKFRPPEEEEEEEEAPRAIKKTKSDVAPLPEEQKNVQLAALGIFLEHSAALARKGPLQDERIGALCKDWGYCEHIQMATVMKEIRYAKAMKKPFAWFHYFPYENDEDEENEEEDGEPSGPSGRERLMMDFDTMRQESVLRVVEDFFKVKRQRKHCASIGGVSYKLNFIY